VQKNLTSLFYTTSSHTQSHLVPQPVAGSAFYSCYIIPSGQAIAVAHYQQKFNALLSGFDKHDATCAAFIPMIALRKMAE
jgi:hypothetical protein